jgi:hypothetical protein
MLRVCNGLKFAAFSLGLCLVAPVLADEIPSSEPQYPAGRAVSPLISQIQIQRYTIPNYTSQNRATTRSFVAVTILNNATTSCNASVSFQFAFGTTNVCLINQLILAKQSRIYCSRLVRDPVAPCSVSCSPELTFNTGHAYVSSDNTVACGNIDVDAQQYFTEGPADDHVDSQSKLTITKFNVPNNGD